MPILLLAAIFVFLQMPGRAAAAISAQETAPSPIFAPDDYALIGVDPSKTRALAWGDVDGDGDLDLMVDNGTTTSVSGVKLGKNQLFENVNGRLNPNPIWESDDYADTRSLAWGDVDGDGDLDLAVGN